MGASNTGLQKIAWKFKTAVDSDLMDIINQDIFCPGVYSGLAVTKLSDISISIAIGNYIISDGTYTALIANTAAAIIAIENTTPYIIIRWTYSATDEWYADFLCVAHASLLATDVIIGKGLFSGSTLSSITYGCQTLPNKVNFETIYNNLRVEENSTPAMNVIVSAGFIVTNDGAKHSWASPQTKTITASDATNPRIDLVVVDTAGALQVIAGTPAGSPAAPSYAGNFVLAEVYVAANVTVIYQENITDVRNFFTSSFTAASVFNTITALTPQTSMVSSDELAFSRSSVGYKITYDNFKKINIVTTAINYTIADTLINNTIIICNPNTAAQYGLLTVTVPTIADNIGKEFTIRYGSAGGATGGLIMVDGEGAETLSYSGSAIPYIWLFQPGDEVTVYNDGVSWKIKHCNSVLTSGYINTIDWTTRHLGFAVIPYDTKDAATDYVGLTGIEETSNNTFVVLYDSGGVGNAGNLYCYLVTGTGFFTNNKTLTMSNGGTAEVNTATTTKNIDSNCYHGLGLNMRKFANQFELFVSSDKAENNVIQILNERDYQDLGCSLYQVDTNNVLEQTASNGIGYTTDVGGRTVLAAQDIYYIIQISFKI